MPEDYYDNASESVPAAPPAEKEGGDEDKTPEGKLGLVPMSFFKDKVQPGDREMVEVVDVYDNEVSIKCIYSGDEEKGEGETPEPGMSEGAAAAPATDEEMMT